MSVPWSYPDLADAVEYNPTLLSWGKLGKWCFLSFPSNAWHYRTANQRVLFVSHVEMKHILLLPHLLCFSGGCEWDHSIPVGYTAPGWLGHIKSPLLSPAVSWHSLPCKHLSQLLPGLVLHPWFLFQHQRNIKWGEKKINNNRNIVPSN